MSKGSLADRDLDLSYGARKVWFWHQICQYYTVCHHVEAYTLGRLSIDGFSFERVAQSNLEWIFGRLDSGFQSLVGFRIPSAGFRIPKPRIPDSTSKKFLDSGIRIPLHGAKIGPDTNPLTFVLTAAKFWPQLWLAVRTMPQDLIGCWNQRKLKALIPRVVVFANDQPSAERRIDFSVLFIVLWSYSRKISFNMCHGNSENSDGCSYLLRICFIYGN